MQLTFVTQKVFIFSIVPQQDMMTIHTIKVIQNVIPELKMMEHIILTGIN